MKRYVINLCRRPDKLHRFFEHCPWPDIEVVHGFDHHRCPPPSWWGAGPPAWGCYRSHFNLIERALNDGFDEITILEDDAAPCSDFARRYDAYVAALPADWGLAYLGGQHLFASWRGRFKAKPGAIELRDPVPINDLAYRPYDCHRCHAYQIRRPLMVEVYQWLCEWGQWYKTDHIDHHLGAFQRKAFVEGKSGIYCPAEWLFNQLPGLSDIKCGYKPVERWASAREICGR